MKLSAIENELVAGRRYFKTFSPGPLMLINHELSIVAKTVFAIYNSIRQVKRIHEAPSFANYVGDFAAGRIIRIGTKPVRTRVTGAHLKVRDIQRDPKRKNGLGGRSWITKPGQYPLVIIFHDANRAGPHIDVHIGRLSVIYRVKPELYEQLKFNRDGMLTENSRKLIIEHVKSEIANGSRVPQNLDHSRTNAKASWTGGSPEDIGYGAGTTRQVVLESTVDVYKTHANGPIEFYAPALNPHRGMYIYQIYPGERSASGKKSAPILIWGNKTASPPKLEDRLHLKMIDPKDIEKLYAKADMSTSTAKYDGSSCYFVITKDGTTVWSPRTSVITGEQIEYTYKLESLPYTLSTSGETIVGMGELLFRERRPFGLDRIPYLTRTPYLASGEGSGLLNANRVLPRSIEPEIRIYRIDRIGRKNTKDLPFWENRELQKEVAKLDSHFKVVELMTPEEAKAKGFEGVVVVPEGGSVNDGYKVKWWGDDEDWRIDKVAFEYSDGGNIAGVLYATSLETGRQFKLGPGQVGDRTTTEHMLNNPEDYEGVVLKVHGRQGHQARAAKVTGFHDDKGVAAVSIS